jgi:hypothetical protein
MSYEIVYTSSESGLKPGERGFCTVGATKGIATPVLSLLESLSGYRHKKEPGHPENPIVYSHLLLKSGESILSRVADAGLDYSKRSNKIAHHLVLPPMERPAEGPSRTLVNSETMFDRWEGESRFLQKRRIAAAAELIGPCSVWAALTGDAAWAALLADTATGTKKREAFVVYQPGTDCLKLIDEALSLLPPQDRWQVTFSTFFTKNQAVKSPCQWRFIQKGEPEEKEIPLHSSVLKLDLASPLGPLPDSPLAQQARTGERPERNIETVNKPASTPEVTKKKPAAPINIPRPVPTSPPSLEDSPFDLPPGNTPPQKKLKRRKSTNKLLIYGLGIVLILGSIIGAGVTFLSLRSDQVAQVDLPPSKDSSEPSKEVVSTSPAKANEATDEDSGKSSKGPLKSEPPVGPATSGGQASQVEATKTEETTGKSENADKTGNAPSTGNTDSQEANPSPPVLEKKRMLILIPPEQQNAKIDIAKFNFENPSFKKVRFNSENSKQNGDIEELDLDNDKIQSKRDSLDLAPPTPLLNIKGGVITVPTSSSWKIQNSLLLVTGNNNEKVLCHFPDTVDIRFPAPVTESKPDPKTDFILPLLSFERIRIDSSKHAIWKKEQGKNEDQSTDDPNKLIFTLECQAPNTAQGQQSPTTQAQPAQKITGKIAVLLDPKEMKVSVKELPRMPPGQVDDPDLPTFEDLKNAPEKTEIILAFTYESADINGEKYDVTLHVPLKVDIEAISKSPLPQAASSIPTNSPQSQNQKPGS